MQATSILPGPNLKPIGKTESIIQKEIVYRVRRGDPGRIYEIRKDVSINDSKTSIRYKVYEEGSTLPLQDSIIIEELLQYIKQVVW